jgi:hypothetical protein
VVCGHVRLIPAIIPADNVLRVEYTNQITQLRLLLLIVDGDAGVAAFAEDVFDELDLAADALEEQENNEQNGNE